MKVELFYIDEILIFNNVTFVDINKLTNKIDLKQIIPSENGVSIYTHGLYSGSLDDLEVIVDGESVWG